MSLYRLAPTVLALPLFIYLYIFFKRIFGLIWKQKYTAVRKLCPALLALTITVPSMNFFSLWALVVLYFTGISAAVDIVRLLVVKLCCRESRFWHTVYLSGAIPALITALVLGYAYINMHIIIKTEYTVTTDKNIREEGYDAVFLSDLHFGTTMDADRLAEICSRIEESRPSFVILGGDIVDERTSLEGIRDVFRILAGINSAYGVYYVYGNHDKGFYGEDCAFTEEQLQDAIEESGITILEDETYEINEELSITGRIDRTVASVTGIPRKASVRLLSEESTLKYHIIAEHQPRGIQQNQAAGFDLMLSGHTHAGQMWPVGLATTLFDKETINYGHKKSGDMDIIVSSGIAGWGYPLRTGKHCEYVVVHIRK
ncbi:MAG: metallophosphoesterase [Eubacteriales bacterium]|nr:metallophosphoesterase [Eubacteriales bacterium]